MARVTPPGGRVAVLEFDLGTTFLDHPGKDTTRIILGTFTDAAVQGRIGGMVPCLFRRAGLTDVSVTPVVILSNELFWRILHQRHVAQLHDQGLLTGGEAGQWWTELEGQAPEGSFLGGVTIVVAAASRPASALRPPRVSLQADPPGNGRFAGSYRDGRPPARAIRIRPCV